MSDPRIVYLAVRTGTVSGPILYGGLHERRRSTLPPWPAQTGSNYPQPLDQPCNDQSSQRLARPRGPDPVRSKRDPHRARRLVQPAVTWHSHEDEFVWVLEGELTLVTDNRR